MKWGVRRAQKKYNKKAQRQIDANLRNAKAIRNELKTDSEGWLSVDSTNTTKNAYKHEQRLAIDTANHWVDVQKRISKQTTVADVKREYKDAIKKAKVYYPFG